MLFVQTVLVIVNVLTIILGAAFVGCGIYAAAVFRELTNYFNQDGVVILLVSGSLIIAFSLLGCVGAIKKNKCLLTPYLFGMFVFAGGAIAAGATVLAYGKNLGTKDEMVARELSNVIVKAYSNCCPDKGAEAFKIKECDPIPPKTKPAIADLFTCMYPAQALGNNCDNPGCVNTWANANFKAADFVRGGPVCTAIDLLVFHDSAGDKACNGFADDKAGKEAGMKKYGDAIHKFVMDNMQNGGIGCVVLGVILGVVFVCGCFIFFSKKEEFDAEA